ncbi:MAG: hypothetical protein PWQ96_1818 [Clostridia bacterium]|jgi:glutamate synthase domain-containing protein 3|nr:glutamate synthase, alpha subunit domain protein [Clostridiales bacterium]MDK2986174.1 hypothetical protein [Clostridia bacterium]
MVTIDAKGVYYKELNEKVKEAISSGAEHIELINVNGQRYIGDGISASAKITIHGIPGNDMAAFMNGPTIEVFGNGQDAVGNTMNSGTIVIHGNAGDVTGYAMRGGEIFIKGNVGYRVGIHMKAYQDKVPVMVIGGKAGDFFAEYMAGGKIILLGLGCEGESVVGRYCATGLHGGTLYIRNNFEERYFGKEVQRDELTMEDKEFLKSYLTRFSDYFGYDKQEILGLDFIKFVPVGSRPYGNMYAKW